VADWSSDEEGMVRGCLSVYLELMTILGAYRHQLVLVGGWAPYFLLEAFGDPDRDFRHVGSLDIDLPVDHRRVGPDDYASIVERLERHGCLDLTQPFQPTVNVPSVRIGLHVSVDRGVDPGTAKGRHGSVGGLGRGNCHV